MSPDVPTVFHIGISLKYCYHVYNMAKEKQLTLIETR